LFRDKRPVDAEVVADAAADAEIVIDARPDAAVLPCTADGLVGCGTATVFSCGGHCWVSCSTATTRAKASTACTGWQGALGQIDDAAEQSCVVSHAGSVSWIGLVQSDAATAPAQGWVWNTDANPVVYTNWRPPDPDDGGGGGERHAEQCGLIQVGTQWDDVNCAEQQRFLCER
jgi:hypothetical protein